MPVNSFDDYLLTWKPEKSKLSSPLYRSIASMLEYDIINGFLLPHTKLPPQRELADYLDINLSTMTRAFKLCEVKGLIYAITGSGTYVAPSVRNAIYSKEYQNIIEMGIIHPIDETNKMVSDTVKNIVNKDYLESLLNYSYPLGMPYHLMAAKKWIEKANLDMSVDNISITSGGQNTLALALTTMFNPGDKLAVDVYTYPNFIELANLLHIQLVPVKSDETGMIPAELEAVCNLVQGVYLIPTCQNPTAVTMDMQRRKELAKIINTHRLTLIEDDIFSFLGEENLLPISHFVPNHFVYGISTSKSINSGLRIGYVAYSNQFIDKIQNGIFNLNVKTSSFNAEVITELINNGVAEQIVLRKKQLIQERNKIYTKYFNIPANELKLSFFRWLPIPLKAAVNIEARALEQGIQIYHSDRFLTKKHSEAQFIRLSISSPKDTNELETGLLTLKNMLGNTMK
ncbi:aminotransferase-like domain-containing protein [Alkalicoccobacillus murimartini]|uniref:DNA-binding transcriptional MocR family regulator n=1 Tax=Alkalicoccobacillus murimartini TaxID=171685 RepID=A0ABT9YCY5_9BACI|nr:PLP-dependent aminotransferase family protein [Alkalicoccobacillus murimartini]MDQ0205718.1 DNA-binding transcriptional MocR family regulator [Alkalicoccobacillus murimartini]